MTVPEWLRAELTRDYGENETERICGGFCKRPASFRVNSLKADRETLLSSFTAAGIVYYGVPWQEDCFITENTEAELRALPAYERGEFYLQSLSSALPPLFLEPRAGENILDMCAAPGGKTAQLFALSGGKALLCAVERDKIRCDRLRYNLKKQGVNATVLNTDALKLDEFMRFDKILLDAPCSGSGTLTPDTPLKISEKLKNNCAILQEKLLLKGIKLLKKGGRMVYSTCSVCKAENERVVARALARGGVRLLPFDEARFSALPRLIGMENTLTVCPNGQYEGFFVAVLEKTR